MNNSLARLDLTQIFCDIDDFYQVLSHLGEAEPKPPYDPEAKQYLHSRGWGVFTECAYFASKYRWSVF